MINMIFRPWNGEGEEAISIRDSVRALLISDEIWDTQRIDACTKEQAFECTFPEGTFIAVFFDGLPAVGYILYVPKAPGVWEQHTAFDKEHRGSYALDCSKQAIAAMFMRTDAFHLVSPCPEWLPAAHIFAKKLGGTVFYRHHGAFTRDGRKQWADMYSLHISAWAGDVHADYEHIGEQWHEAAFAKLEEHHDEDPAHNGFLGLAIAIAKYNPAKAVAVYNSWAQIAGYHPANLIMAHPSGLCVLDIGNAVVTMVGDTVAAAVPYPSCPPSSPLPQLPAQEQA